MAELVELSSDKHLALKVKPDACLMTAASQHAISLNVAEVGQAISSFPVFFTKMEQDGQWAISAMTSLEVGSNLFCQKATWNATYMPSSMRTYPLFLIRSVADENKLVIGIDEENIAFSKNDGEALFDSNGKPSLYQSRAGALLDTNLQNSFHTHQYFEKLQALDLLKPIDLNVMRNYMLYQQKTLKVYVKLTIYLQFMQC